MRKCELLTKLRQFIFSGNLIKGVYIDVNVCGEPRYCPIGFLLKQLGLTDLELIYLTESTVKNNLYFSTPKIKDILAYNVNLPKEILSKIKFLLLNYGFTEQELIDLEEKNDGIIHEELYISIHNLLNKDCVCHLKTN